MASSQGIAIKWYSSYNITGGARAAGDSVGFLLEIKAGDTKNNQDVVNK